MVSLDNAIVARYEFMGDKFELFVDPDLALLYRTGQKKDLANLFVIDEVFKDARKGERHTDTVLRKVFGTTDFNQIAEIILNKGDVPLTTEQRKKLLEEKTKQIITILARECVDPRTGAPHPPQRIEKAMEEAKIHVDAFKNADAQIDGVLKELRLLLPLKFEKVRIAVRITADQAVRAYGTLKEFHIVKEEWQPSGALIAVLEMPAGLQGDFFNRINKATAGQAETKIVK
jgi:ribosome maturation protein SDO1